MQIYRRTSTSLRKQLAVLASSFAPTELRLPDAFPHPAALSFGADGCARFSNLLLCEKCSNDARVICVRYIPSQTHFVHRGASRRAASRVGSRPLESSRACLQGRRREASLAATSWLAPRR